MTDSDAKKEYKDTLFLPVTDFPMRAGLPQREPEILSKWYAQDLYKKLRQQSVGKEKFVLHDGPPYANGHLHIGHALNKILKDMIVKTKQMSGFDANYVPGWDCHGLPIEWKIEEEYRKKKQNKDDVDINEFRSQCRKYASDWLEIQKQEFKRLGVVGDWDNPYNTMKNHSESVIAGELLKFAESGQLYRSSKPVFWSCVEKTALADAETEYEDKESDAIWVKFPVEYIDGDVPSISPITNRCYIPIWTTTPWTIPANMAVACGQDIKYAIYEVIQETADDNWVKKHECYILAESRASDFFQKARIETIENGGYKLREYIEVFDLQKLLLSHPFKILFIDKHSYSRFTDDRPVLIGNFVTDDAGTGFVHIAPGHGEDDYKLFLDNSHIVYPSDFHESFSDNTELSLFPEQLALNITNGTYYDKSNINPVRFHLKKQYPIENIEIINAEPYEKCASFDEEVRELACHFSIECIFHEKSRVIIITILNRLLKSDFYVSDLHIDNLYDSFCEKLSRSIFEQYNQSDTSDIINDFLKDAQNEDDNNIFKNYKNKRDNKYPLKSIYILHRRGFYQKLDTTQKLISGITSSYYEFVPIEDILHTIQPDGGYYPHVPQFWKKTDAYADKNNVYILKPDGKNGNANDAVIQTLIAVNGLAARGKIKHSYPHSWRSKAPLIYRNTAQWFVSMESHGLRKTALNALKNVTFYPERGRNRITGMIETRPDWVVSRQRAWGVPLALFVSKSTGKILNNAEMNQNILNIFDAESSDAWWIRPANDFFPDFDSEKHEQIMDILDVWFDSGSTHAFVLEDRDDLSSPADLYLEGSDQHRGWFHSSLLESCGTRGVAPYKAVLTHGFVLDEKGEKMSKSKGNVVTPQSVMDEYGADILRLWVASSDYSGDLRIGKEILKGTADKYRRLRNTIRWMLGALDGYMADDTPLFHPENSLEQWALHKLSQVTASVLKSYDAYQYGQGLQTLFDFCTNDLSSFYFDVRKDMLYCNGAECPQRIDLRRTIHIILVQILKLIAPICPFTADEAWGYINTDTIHLTQFDTVIYDFSDAFDATEQVRHVRSVVNACLEQKRAVKDIGASLESKPTVYISDKDLYHKVISTDFADICITSGISVMNDIVPDDAFRISDIHGVGVIFYPAEGKKCARCWKILPEVSDDLCRRCESVVG